MATLKKQTIEKKVVQIVEEEQFLLTLSRDEAQYLRDLLGHISAGLEIGWKLHQLFYHEFDARVYGLDYEGPVPKTYLK